MSTLTSSARRIGLLSAAALCLGGVSGLGFGPGRLGRVAASPSGRHALEARARPDSSRVPQATQAAPVATKREGESRSKTTTGKTELRGDVFMARKMYQQAIAEYADALAEQPAVPAPKRPGFFGRLFGFWRGSKTPPQPKASELENKIGIAYQQLGDSRHAELYYRRACQADASFANPRNNLGTVEFGRQNYGGAIAQYRRATRIDPRNATFFVNLGYANFARKNGAEAIRNFRQALAVDPLVFQHIAASDVVVEDSGNVNSAAYDYLLAKTFAMLGNAERAAHYLRMARDEGYRKLTGARTDSAFRGVLKDRRVQQILNSVASPDPPQQ